MHLRAVAVACAVALLACDSEPSDAPVQHQLVFELDVAEAGGADTLITRLTVDEDERVAHVDLTAPSPTLSRPCQPGATVTWRFELIGALAGDVSRDVAPLLNVEDTTICNEVVPVTVVPLPFSLHHRVPQGFFDVAVRFDGAGAAGAVVDVDVENGDGVVVADLAVDSRQHGDGPHGLSIVTGCDARGLGNTVTVSLDALFDAAGRPLDFIPAPALTTTAPCRENSDAFIGDFDLTVARWVSDTPADGVMVGASRCRPSIACAGGVTALELACDVDRAAPEYADQPAAVLLDDLSLTCGAMTIALGPLGDAGAQAPGLFDVARPEPLDGDGFGWRYALALTDGAGSCTVSARATIARDALADGEQPALTVLPAFTWRADLDDTGACTPADLGDDGAVGFHYAGPDAHVWPAALSVDLDL